MATRKDSAVTNDTLRGKAPGEPAGSENSATALVYDHLRKQMLTGELRGGAILVEQDVADQLKVSRTPVHEAMRRLGAEGLLDISHRRRARVADASFADIQQLYDIRASLETIACRDAATRVDLAILEKMSAATDEMEGVAIHWDIRRLSEFTEANNRFHQHLLDAADNRWLSKTLRPVLDMLLGPFNTLARHATDGSPHVHPDFLIRSCRQHREIIDALRVRNPAWAAKAMELHIFSAQLDWGGASDRRLDERADARRKKRRRS